MNACPFISWASVHVYKKKKNDATYLSILCSQENARVESIYSHHLNNVAVGKATWVDLPYACNCDQQSLRQYKASQSHVRNCKCSSACWGELNREAGWERSMPPDPLVNIIWGLLSFSPTPSWNTKLDKQLRLSMPDRHSSFSAALSAHLLSMHIILHCLQHFLSST